MVRAGYGRRRSVTLPTVDDGAVVPAQIPGGDDLSDLTPYTCDVARTVLAIPAGAVSTYAEVAAEAGHPGAARGVGRVLRTVPGLPWWRVVNADGRPAPGSERQQLRMLAEEGVELRGRRVRLDR